jgi:hypothetical protein
MLALIGLFSSVGQVSTKYLGALPSSFPHLRGKIVMGIILDFKSTPQDNANLNSTKQAIGQAISAAIYTNKFPRALDIALPGNATLNAQLYGSLTTQLLYPIGSPERTA